MSRTDKTAPWRVKVLYYLKWVEEFHDHAHGTPCELPEFPTVDNLDKYEQLVLFKGEWTPYHRIDRKTRAGLPWHNTCHWTASREYWCSAMARCACDHCDGTHYETSPKKKSRIAAKRYAQRDWRKEY